MSALDDSRNQTGGLETLCDPDLTPRPLRIVKRGGLRESESINTSRTISGSSTQRTLVPTRTSSVSSTSTWSQFPQQNDASRASLCHNREILTPLDKQRHSRSASKTTAANTRSSVSRFFANSELQRQPYNQVTRNSIDNTKGNISAEINTSTAPKSTARRAFTTGTFRKADAHSHMNEQDSSSALPITKRRVVRDAAPIIGEAGSLRHDLRHVLHRQPSGKGFITRIVSNLAHRSNMTPSTVTKQDTSKRAPKDKVLDTSAQKLEPREPLERISESSAGTEGTKNSDLEGVLPAFPTPPTSKDTSPRPSESFTGSQSESRRYRSLRIPEDASIMGAELKLTAEHDQLDSEKGNGMLVAIDIEGATNLTASDQHLWSQHVGLDIVVVVDNSLYTSPSMLMASCETTRAFASILNVVTDRLAILCTSPINDHRTLGSDFSRIWPLSTIRERKLKTVLDAIITTKEKLTERSWAHIIKVATEILLQSPVPDPDTELLQDTFGHVIILTNQASGLSTGLLAHKRLHFHVVCPVSVPLSNFGAIECNGWKLRPNCGSEIQAANTRKNVDPACLINKLRQLIIHARSGKDAGRLTYLSLDIKPGPGCSIQDVMGKSEYLTLHPGELRTVLVRVIFTASRAEADDLPCSPTLPEMGPDSADILKELDRMLKVVPRPVKILTARLKYKHSLLPAGTTCVVTADCRVKKKISSSIRKVDTGKGVSADVIQNRLAYYFATYGSPSRALSAFTTEFGEEGWRSNCPDYTHLIFKELKYQARVAERLEIDASPKKPIFPLTMDMDLSPKFSLDHSISQSFQQRENHRPESWSTDTPDEQVSNSNDSQRALLSDKTNEVEPTKQMKQRMDELMTLWGDVGKPPRALKASTKGRAMSFKHEAQRNDSLERLEQLGMVRHQRSGSQPTALPKKSSLGALTIRRITSAGESMAKGLGAT